MRLLRNIDDPRCFIEVIEYETIEAFRSDEARVRDDPQMQVLLREWRSLLVEGVEIETYEDMTNLI